MVTIIPEEKAFHIFFPNMHITMWWQPNPQKFEQVNTQAINFNWASYIKVQNSQEKELEAQH